MKYNIKNDVMVSHEHSKVIKIAVVFQRCHVWFVVLNMNVDYYSLHIHIH